MQWDSQKQSDRQAARDGGLVEGTGFCSKDKFRSGGSYGLSISNQVKFISK